MGLWRGRRQGRIGGGFSRSCEWGVEAGGGWFLVLLGFLILGLLERDDRFDKTG